MEHATCHPSGTWNFEVACSFLENLCFAVYECNYETKVLNGCSNWSVIWLWVFRNWDASTLKVINAISCWDCMSVISEWICMNHEWNDDNRKNEVLRTKPVPLGSPQIPHGLAWEWIWAWVSTVRGKWLIIWAKARSDRVNLLKPTDYMMHKQVQHSRTVHCPHCIYILYLSEDKQHLVPLTA